MTTKALDLPKGLRGHSKKIDEIVGWCRDWIDQDTFDDLARRARWTSPAGLQGLSGDDFLLSPDSPYLHLMQLLQTGGLIETQERDGVIWYKVKPDGTIRDPRDQK